MCHVGVSKEGRSSCIMVGLSSVCRWVFNKKGLRRWCHVVVHFEAKKSHFPAAFKGFMRSRLSPSRKSRPSS